MSRMAFNECGHPIPRWSFAVLAEWAEARRHVGKRVVLSDDQSERDGTVLMKTCDVQPKPIVKGIEKAFQLPERRGMDSDWVSL